MQCLVWDDAEIKRGERGFLRNFTMLRILKRGILTLLLQRLKTCGQAGTLWKVALTNFQRAMFHEKLFGIEWKMLVSAEKL